jgi:hypothetical protein
MTRSSAAMVRSEDVTEISFKGLLPQLIDVLHALTDGYESLSRKLRDARLEDTCHSVPVVERCLQAGPSEDPRSSVGSRPNVSIGIRREPTMDNIEVDTGRTSVSGFGNGSVPEPRIGVSVVPVSATVPEAASPSDPPAAIGSHPDTLADLSSETSARPDGLNSAEPGKTTTARVNRDYNFFDELDARLAGLKDPADRSED